MYISSLRDQDWLKISRTLDKNWINFKFTGVCKRIFLHIESNNSRQVLCFLNLWLKKLINVDSLIKFNIEIAICFQNGVQIWKGRDRKTVFCRHRKCRANGETFLWQTQLKTVFWLKPFHIWTKIWEHITFYVKTTIFCK